MDPEILSIPFFLNFDKWLEEKSVLWVGPMDQQNVILIELCHSGFIANFFLGAKNLRWQMCVSVLEARSDCRHTHPQETLSTPLAVLARQS